LSDEAEHLLEERRDLLGVIETDVAETLEDVEFELVVEVLTVETGQQRRDEHLDVLLESNCAVLAGLRNEVLIEKKYQGHFEDLLFVDFVEREFDPGEDLGQHLRESLLGGEAERAEHHDAVVVHVAQELELALDDGVDHAHVVLRYLSVTCWMFSRLYRQQWMPVKTPFLNVSLCDLFVIWPQLLSSWMSSVRYCCDRGMDWLFFRNERMKANAMSMNVTSWFGSADRFSTVFC